MLQLAAVFSDHMVLQREKNIMVFGIGDIGAIITVSIPERKIYASTTVREDGNWRLQLPPQPAGTGLTLRAKDDKTEVTFRDVAIGEVWLAGGQSNMEFLLKNAVNGKLELFQCEKSRVRYYDVPNNDVMHAAYFQAERKNAWQLPSEKTAGNWSAVAYFAAKEIAQKLGVVVGIIGCNYGGTSASCWVPSADLTAHFALQPYWTAYLQACRGKTDAEMAADYAGYVAYHRAWKKRLAACYQENPNMKWDNVIERCGENRYPGPMGSRNPLRPCGLYKSMLSRVAPYTLRGFWYYQGENDDNRPSSYALLLSVLIARWRKDWGDENLPFMLVQLPMFAYEGDEERTNWAELREAQAQVCRTLRNTGLAVTMDCGEYNNMHPVEKRTVAHRLALQTLYRVYRTVPAATAEPAYCKNGYISGGAYILQFSQAVLPKEGTTPFFELAGADGVYYPAVAEFRDCFVRLTAKQVRMPVAMRYAWRNWCTVSLYGQNEIPVASFRLERP
jgi:sialate O-acetylesterase